MAWGNNQSGQLGDGKAPEDHGTPAEVRGLGPGSGVVEIAAGSSFAIVRKNDGSVWTWGNGTSGQLGDGTNGKRSAPTPVHGLEAGSGVVSISAGGAHVLALKADAQCSLGGTTGPVSSVTAQLQPNIRRPLLSAASALAAV